MSNQYQYRKADKGLYGPLKIEQPNYKDYSFFTDNGYEVDGISFLQAENAFNDHIASLPRVASVPSCEWEDGEIVEEGKDYRLIHQVKYQFEGNIWRACDEFEYSVSHVAMRRLIAVPISGGEVKEEETKLPERLKQLDSRQDMIAFAEFISGEGWQQYDGKNRWICPTESNRVISTSQLLDEYLKSISVNNKQQ